MVDLPLQPSLNGHVDIVTPLLVAGWVRDLADPDRRLDLNLVQNGAVVAVTQAEMMRPDLAQAGIGDGGYGFQFHAISAEQPLPPGPAAIRDALTGAVIPEGTIIIPGEALAAAPEPPPAPEPRLEGHVDLVSAGLISGWVLDLSALDARLELHLLQDGQLIGAAIADEPRTDLEQAGIGDGAYGFTLHDLLPDQPWKPGAASIHDARTGAVIPGGAVTLLAGDATAPVFEWPAMADAAPAAELPPPPAEAEPPPVVQPPATPEPPAEPPSGAP